MFAVVGVAVAYRGLAFNHCAGEFFINCNFTKRREPGAFIVNGGGLADVAVRCAEDDKSIDLWVLLFDCGKDNRRRCAAERPAGVRDETRDYYIGQFRQAGSCACFIEALLYFVNALVTLAGVKLAGHYGSSLLHIAHPSVAFTAPSRYDYTIIRDVNIL